MICKSYTACDFNTSNGRHLYSYVRHFVTKLTKAKNIQICIFLLLGCAGLLFSLKLHMLKTVKTTKKTCHNASKDLKFWKRFKTVKMVEMSNWSQRPKLWKCPNLFKRKQFSKWQKLSKCYKAAETLESFDNCQKVVKTIKWQTVHTVKIS